jgi:hypothetical protein
MSRKSLSVRSRFEVFKRDNFTCQYCGAHPPMVILHCDHITPVCEGGGNEIENLITACQSCNLGKAGIPLDVRPASLADRATETAEREAQIAGYEAIMRERRERLDDEAQYVLCEMCEAFGRDAIPRADFRSIKMFVERLGVSGTLSAVDVAVKRFPRSYRSGFRYFCGVCWRLIKDGQGHGEN